MTTLTFVNPRRDPAPVLQISRAPVYPARDVQGVPVDAGDRVAALNLRGEWTVKATDADTAIIMQTDDTGSRCTVVPTCHLRVLV